MIAEAAAQVAKLDPKPGEVVVVRLPGATKEELQAVALDGSLRELHQRFGGVQILVANETIGFEKHEIELRLTPAEPDDEGNPRVAIGVVVAGTEIRYEGMSFSAADFASAIAWVVDNKRGRRYLAPGAPS